MARWIGYVRVSTQEQAGSGLGLEAQEEALRRATHHPDVLVAIARDEGVSGSSLDRPGFQEALAMIAAGEADGLVVSKLDRASRSVPDVAELLDWLTACGASFRALDLGVDTGTATGRLVAGILSTVAEWERSVIGERTKAAAGAKRARGEGWGGSCAYSERPELVERIKAERVAGATYQAIADRLNAEGVPTSRNGARWRVSSVQSVCGLVRPPKRRGVTKLPAVPRRRAKGRVAA